MQSSLQNVDRMKDYYCAQHLIDGVPKSIYQIWEDGGALNDSITPSTASREYRSHMLLKIMSLTAPGSLCLSLGCGNGFVEAELLKHGRRVRAVDTCEEAVRLSLDKGVDARLADIYAIGRDIARGVGLVYADGLLGHLFHPQHELEPFVGKLKTLDLEPGSCIVLSNDAPADPGAAVLPHPHVEGFWLLSRHYLAETLAAAGFKVREHYYFPYLRPISGLRQRTICIAEI